MTLFSHTINTSTTDEACLSEKSSHEPITFAEFLFTTRAYGGPRGAMLRALRARTLAGGLPVIPEWRDVYLAIKDQPEMIPHARLLWTQFSRQPKRKAR